MDEDAPSAILQANKLNDPETVRKRSKLMLPAPQISDHELEEIARMGYASDLLVGSEELAEGSGATHALLANYGQTPLQGTTPLRTPQRTPAGKGDAIMMEAENLARLRESQTPLLGGENPELHPSDFSGVTPKKRENQTPNPMLTPSATPGGAGLTPRIGMTPSRDGYSFSMTPKGTPIRDELHINEDLDMHDGAKLDQRKQADLRRNLRSGLSNLPQPKNEYQVVMQPVPEDNEELEEKIEEDMSDRLARQRAAEEARQQALLRKRSKVLQRELPRPPAASLDLIRNSLIRADEDKSSFVPPTSIEQADEMVRKELLSLLEHDNAKYPLEKKLNKEKKKSVKRSADGSAYIPEIEDFEEEELKEADSLIEEEAHYLHLAMGHENQSLDEFVEAHKTCLNDLMYFPTRNAYGLSSVAGNLEKLAALQNEFEYVKKKMDGDKVKAESLENKVKVLTHGYETRAKTVIWPKVEATLKQMDTAATELECFKALQKQEQVAASHRINSLWEEVQKQKELERTLQGRYGDRVAELDRMQHLMEEYRVQAQEQEEIAAKNHAFELAKAVEDQTVAQSITTHMPIPSTDPVQSSNDENAGQRMGAEQEHAYHNIKPNMDVDAQNEHAQFCMVESLPMNIANAVGEDNTTPGQGNSFEGAVIQLSPAGTNDPSEAPDMMLLEENKRVIDLANRPVDDKITTELMEENPNKVVDQQNVGDATNLNVGLSEQEDCVPETAGNDVCANGDPMQVSSGEVRAVNSAGDNINQMPNVVNLEDD
ncbi:Cell division cycle 5-like protein [Morella rubra]|uniref:Cell division cycle 5-like protein n=1 Tax=Morella rubra TaxID=262757 RepID=A0A6A1VDG1_9ROSI|nr:Cell division cycle 5-like protein [Morella rubra]